MGTCAPCRRVGGRWLLTAAVLATLAGPAPATALSLCARTRGPNGGILDGAIVRLRQECKRYEKALPLRVEEDLVLVTGANLQVVDGSGSTDGATNGKGNLIVGYNENPYDAVRTGSHNLVVGSQHQYRSYVGIVAGLGNAIDGAHATVTGGSENVASGDGASISGGLRNWADGAWSSVGGGRDNGAIGEVASIAGGDDNHASGLASAILGGSEVFATGFSSTVSGGLENLASGAYSSIGGGSGGSV